MYSLPNKRHFPLSTETLRAGKFEIFTRFLSAVVGVGPLVLMRLQWQTNSGVNFLPLLRVSPQVAPYIAIILFHK